VENHPVALGRNIGDGQAFPAADRVGDPGVVVERRFSTWTKACERTSIATSALDKLHIFEHEQMHLVQTLRKP